MTKFRVTVRAVIWIQKDGQRALDMAFTIGAEDHKAAIEQADALTTFLFKRPKDVVIFKVEEDYS